MAGLSRFVQVGAALAVWLATSPALAGSVDTPAFYVAEVDNRWIGVPAVRASAHVIRDRRGGRLWLGWPPLLSGRDVSAARVEFDAARRATLSIRLTREGAAALAYYIDGHVGFPGAVVLDGKVLAVPILDGKMEDSGVIDLRGDLGADANRVAARIQQVADRARLEGRQPERGRGL